MWGPPGTSLYSGYPLATIRITPPIKNASPDVQFLAQYANALAFQYAFHNRQPKLRRKNTVCCHSNLPFAAVCPYFRCLKIGVHLNVCDKVCPRFECKKHTNGRLRARLPGAWRSSKSRSRQPRLATLPSEASRVSPRAHHAERRSMLRPLPSTLSAI